MTCYVHMLGTHGVLRRFKWAWHMLRHRCPGGESCPHVSEVWMETGREGESWVLVSGVSHPDVQTLRSIQSPQSTPSSTQMYRDAIPHPCVQKYSVFFSHKGSWRISWVSPNSLMCFECKVILTPYKVLKCKEAKHWTACCFGGHLSFSPAAESERPQTAD